MERLPAVAQCGCSAAGADGYQGFPESELADGVHPNAAGYARMANKWYDAIERYLE